MVAAPLAVLAGATVPQSGAQGVPFWERVHFTPLLARSCMTLAVICCVALITTLAEVAERDMEGGWKVIAARPTAVLSDTEVA